MIATMLLTGTSQEASRLVVASSNGSLYEVWKDASSRQLSAKVPEKFIEVHDGAPVWKEKGELVTWFDGGVKPITFSQGGDKLLHKLFDREYLLGIQICQEEDLVREVDMKELTVKYWRLSSGSLLKVIDAWPFACSSLIGQVVIPPKTLWPGRKGKTENYELVFADPNRKNVVFPNSISGLVCDTFLQVKDGTIYILGHEENKGTFLATFKPSTNQIVLNQLGWPENSFFLNQFLTESDDGVIASLVSEREIRSTRLVNGELIPQNPVSLAVVDSYKDSLQVHQMRSGEAVFVNSIGYGVFDARLNRLIWKKW